LHVSRDRCVGQGARRAVGHNDVAIDCSGQSVNSAGSRKQRRR
jgi:hypothetical protein